MIKVGIDINAMHPESAGIGRFVYNLIKAMNEIQTDEFDFDLLTGLKTRIDFKLNPGFHINNAFRLVKSGLLRSNLLLPLCMSLKKYDLFHGLYPNAIPLYNRKSKIVLTVHDLIILLFPQYCTKKQYTITSNFFRRAIRLCDGIIADSENTKMDLLKFFNFPADKIEVIYAGYDSNRFYISDDKALLDKIRAKHDLDTDFLLYTGTLEPRKNIPLLLKAFSNIIRTSDFRDLKLVLAGAKGWLYNEIFEIIIRLKLKNRVIFTGYIDDNELNALYNMAEIFIYPTRYEGFGLPVLEAMACGTPVISTRISSIPEVTGDAAILIEPENVDELTQKILLLLTDKVLYDGYVRAGFERIKLFSWEKAARQTFDFYKKVMKA